MVTDSRLDTYINSYGSFNDWLIERRYQKLQQYFSGNSCLEMGIAEGTGVQNLLNHFEKVTVIDGSSRAIKSIKQRFNNPGFEAVQAFFEHMHLDERFDTIIMAHILEHVDNPITVLEQAKKFINPGGVFIIDVPNGNSLHRQIGVQLGLLKQQTDLNEADLSIGHQRVYTPDTFKKDVEMAGLKIIHFGGMFIKTLSNAQMEKAFDAQQLEAMFIVGEKNPRIAAEMYIIATT